jgi:putative DNA primase/helicase
LIVHIATPLAAVALGLIDAEGSRSDAIEGAAQLAGVQNYRIVDLRTGKLDAKPRPDLYCTKQTAVAPSETAHCPLFLKFLSDITKKRTELQRYLQRVAGYCLTGDMREQCLFFCYGAQGRNGKGVLLRTIAKIMKDYATNTGEKVFLETKNERHTQELARLVGARFVFAGEMPKGAVWNETLIKGITGGDKQTARFMRENDFEFWPQCKLVFSGNFRPKLRTVGNSMRDRMRIVPFDRSFARHEQDLALEDKLVAEFPGILRWMIEGCLQWQAQGLNPPAEVMEATETYLDAEDPIASWLRECCARKADGWTPSADLYASYKEHVGRTGDGETTVVNTQAFADVLLVAGFKPSSRQRPGTDKQVRGYAGVILQPREPVAANPQDLEGIL